MLHRTRMTRSRRSKYIRFKHHINCTKRVVLNKCVGNQTKKSIAVIGKVRKMKYSRYARWSHFILYYFNTIGMTVYDFEGNFSVTTPYIRGIKSISMRYKISEKILV